MIIRIPIVRFALGFHTYTFIHKNVQYHNQQVLEEDAQRGWVVVREESRSLVFHDVRYALKSEDDTVLAFVRGYSKSRKNFYIERIENLARDTNGFHYIRTIATTMERDLRLKGYDCATLLASPKLAPILISRFGFHSVRGITSQELKKGWRRRIPWKLILLKKT